jgi:biotin operon repressor
MLPKDIENLRTANTGLAEELDTLRQSVRDAVEVIKESGNDITGLTAVEILRKHGLLED